MSAAIPIERLKDCMLDLKNPIAKRTHAAFHLRTLGTVEAVNILCEALLIREDTPLMRHEIAYILGQIGHHDACPVLSGILCDEADDVLVRHESAEALGAIGNPSSIDVLRQFSSHSAPEISETCQIAIDLIQWRSEGNNDERTGGYLSVDPAPPFDEQKTVESLKQDLTNSSLSLFNRYRAMFSLRNLNSDDSALALLAGFNDDSALFRHEVAYVLGQMQRLVTVEGLGKVLENLTEHRMVRHEAAEALGAIGGTRAEALLAQYSVYSSDESKAAEEQVVVESCVVALDAMDYWSNGDFSGEARDS